MQNIRTSKILPIFDSAQKSERKWLRISDKNKKALSEIITSILLILVAIMAVTIVSLVIKNQVKQVNFSPEKLCIFDINPLTIKNACYNQETSDLQVTIIRNNLQNQKIDEFSFIVNSDQESSQYKCGCDNCKILASGEKTYYISQSIKPNQVSLKLDSCILESKSVEDC